MMKESQPNKIQYLNSLIENFKRRNETLEKRETETRQRLSKLRNKISLDESNSEESVCNPSQSFSSITSEEVTQEVIYSDCDERSYPSQKYHSFEQSLKQSDLKPSFFSGGYVNDYPSYAQWENASKLKSQLPHNTANRCTPLKIPPRSAPQERRIGQHTKNSHRQTERSTLSRKKSCSERIRSLLKLLKTNNNKMSKGDHRRDKQRKRLSCSERRELLNDPIIENILSRFNRKKHRTREKALHYEEDMYEDAKYIFTQNEFRDVSSNSSCSLHQSSSTYFDRRIKSPTSTSHKKRVDKNQFLNCNPKLQKLLRDYDVEMSSCDSPKTKRRLKVPHRSRSKQQRNQSEYHSTNHKLLNRNFETSQTSIDPQEQYQDSRSLYNDQRPNYSHGFRKPHPTTPSFNERQSSQMRQQADMKTSYESKVEPESVNSQCQSGESDRYLDYLIESCCSKSLPTVDEYQEWTNENTQEVLILKHDIESLKKRICDELKNREKLGNPYRLRRHDKLVLVRNVKFANALNDGLEKRRSIREVIIEFYKSNEIGNTQVLAQGLNDSNVTNSESFRDSLGPGEVQRVIECLRGLGLVNANPQTYTSNANQFNKLLKEYNSKGTIAPNEFVNKNYHEIKQMLDQGTTKAYEECIRAANNVDRLQSTVDTIEKLVSGQTESPSKFSNIERSYTSLLETANLLGINSSSNSMTLNSESIRSMFMIPPRNVNTYKPTKETRTH